ncbi:MAG: DUF4168 domain-containing protein [Alphaproteobacteria bacterium]|nr:DUF4168 domain-containing protein [Alphaproteobacteria bacterium]
MKLSHLTAAAAATLALGATACASSNDVAAPAPAAAAAAPAPAQTAQPAQPAQPAPAPAETAAAPAMPAPTAMTDAQLESFIAAEAEIGPAIAPHTDALRTGTPEQQAAARTAIEAAVVPILERHGLDGPTYNAIAREAQQNEAFNLRLAALREGEGAEGSAEAAE